MEAHLPRHGEFRLLSKRKFCVWSDESGKAPALATFYGVINWAELVRECHFVDNTACIRELEDCKTPVFLRPKRFGKSIVCSMLAPYYDVALKDRFDELFGRTDIGRAPTPLRNSFLVLPFDFSTVQVGTIAEIERNFMLHVRGRVERFAAQYARHADWSGVLKMEKPAAMIDSIRDIVHANRLPRSTSSSTNTTTSRTSWWS